MMIYFRAEVQCMGTRHSLCTRILPVAPVSTSSSLTEITFNLTKLKL